MGPRCRTKAARARTPLLSATPPPPCTPPLASCSPTCPHVPRPPPPLRPPRRSLLLAAAPGAAAQKRVRRELRSLTDKQYRSLIMGLSTMNTVPTAAGRKLFGPQYISYMELMLKHAVAVNDPRGDQVRARVRLCSHARLLKGS